jgi:hypothetical protein
LKTKKGLGNQAPTLIFGSFDRKDVVIATQLKQL